ncbi:MAG: hypothetical protein EOM64_05925 [Erysipelotrichia bacterium]|nr:hypothetical protein [Erysipelotrichia bacterium]
MAHISVLEMIVLTAEQTVKYHHSFRESLQAANMLRNAVNKSEADPAYAKEAERSFAEMLNSSSWEESRSLK